MHNFLLVKDEETIFLCEVFPCSMVCTALVVSGSPNIGHWTVGVYRFWNMDTVKDRCDVGAGTFGGSVLNTYFILTMLVQSYQPDLCLKTAFQILPESNTITPILLTLWGGCKRRLQKRAVRTVAKLRQIEVV